MTGKILLIEDDDATAGYIAKGLSEAGFTVDRATNGRDGLFLGSDASFDAIVLDRMLPGMEGMAVLGALRAAGITTPVLILSALGTAEDRVRGLTSGADDYLVKPFAITELTARIRAVLRRLRPGLAEDVVIRGALALDRSAHRVTRDGVEVHLGPTEFRLLDFFMQNPGRVFSREQLLDAVWGSDVYVEARTVDVHIGRLRKALSKDAPGFDPIRTVRSAGYALEVSRMKTSAD